jgi:hypothetical protein
VPGIEPGPLRFSPKELRPSLFWRTTDQLRPIEIGVTSRIRTGTNAVTGRDASVYIMITMKTGPLVGLAPTNTSLRNSPCCC